MATGSIRWVAANKVITDLTGRGTWGTAALFPYYPGDKIANATTELLFIGPIKGVVSFPVLMSGRKYRDDVFALPLHLVVKNQTDPQAAMTRIVALSEDIDLYVASDPSLGGLDGVVQTDLGDREQGVAITPESGPIAYANITVTVEARYL